MNLWRLLHFILRLGSLCIDGNKTGLLEDIAEYNYRVQLKQDEKCGTCNANYPANESLDNFGRRI
jgi:hypothetical protein